MVTFVQQRLWPVQYRQYMLHEQRPPMSHPHTSSSAAAIRSHQGSMCVALYELVSWLMLSAAGRNKSNFCMTCSLRLVATKSHGGKTPFNPTPISNNLHGMGPFHPSFSSRLLIAFSHCQTSSERTSRGQSRIFTIRHRRTAKIVSCRLPAVRAYLCGLVTECLINTSANLIPSCKRRLGCTSCLVVDCGPE